jgi:cbb3-type cytochrome oxidase subunit 3
MFESLVDVFLEVAKEHGAFVALTIIVLLVSWGTVYWALRQVIKSKNAEIERLVQDRNKLQDIILNRRLSTKKE